MTSFTFSDDLAPELYPLAWLVGTWRGPGVLSYPGISERGIVVEASFTHDGGPYLAYTATTYLLAGDAPAAEQEFDPLDLKVGEIWGTESGFWRIAPGLEAHPVAGAPADGPAPSALEITLSDPSGLVSVLAGSAQGPRIDAASDWMARTGSSTADISAQRRMYGWVHGTIFWAQDIAGFGHELQTYATGRLARLDAQD